MTRCPWIGWEDSDDVFGTLSKIRLRNVVTDLIQEVTLLEDSISLYRGGGGGEMISDGGRRIIQKSSEKHPENWFSGFSAPQL